MMVVSKMMVFKIVLVARLFIAGVAMGVIGLKCVVHGGSGFRRFCEGI